MSKKVKSEWDWEIKPQTSWLGSSLKELIAYKDLLFGLVRKDFLGSYQQTLLGPFWILLQPLLSVLVYMLVFVKIIGLKTNGVPSFLFFLSGISLWNLFSDMFFSTSNVVVANAGVFSKVYFPRLIAPLAAVILNLVRFLINALLLFAVLAYFAFRGDVQVHLAGLLQFIIPVLIVTGIALGCGLIFSIITVKYRDLNGFVQILMRLFMFVCPVFYSMTLVPEKYKWMVDINPLSAQFELFRYSLYGIGLFSAAWVLYGLAFMVVILMAGVLLFNKMAERVVELA
ncbi:ABC transporter permease [Flavihumibacter profundi]|uniref:ABC transporter permease n=1 Tax=Flavihumibacter profundi TaxID=2716883 RepID=UPI001CC7B199|nr:ABC transporter permease [Flavihumibacter profundi]MBZ5858032.1 ABC transporter permease [Flavihumibacter profundi]